ncbi:MAG TPA: hypothetical protein V6D47_18970 [Oscillatoriaceae cyanobacterium]
MLRPWPLVCLLAVGLACLLIATWVITQPGATTIDWSAPSPGETLLKAIALFLLSVLLAGYALYGLLRPTPALELTPQGFHISLFGGYAGMGGWKFVPWSQVRAVRVVRVRNRTYLGVIPIAMPAMPYLAIELKDVAQWEAEAKPNGLERNIWQRLRHKVGADLGLPLITLSLPPNELLELMHHYRFDARNGWADPQVQAWDKPGA